MKTRYKVGIGVLAVFVLAIASLATVLGYTADCEPGEPAAQGANTMRAVVYRCYGPPDVLEVTNVEKPMPGDGQVLVRVRAASVNPLDWHYLRGSPYIMRLGSGIGRPTETRLGVDFAGVVEAVGKDVTRFAPGDEVFGGRTGAFAEYVVVGENRAIARKPGNVTFEEAAAVPIAAITALQALRDKGSLQAGEKVLVNGASGGVGTYAVQIAKAMGADVSGVCSSRNVELVRGLGADRVFDYKSEDYTESGEVYDVVVDNVGNHSLLRNRRAMAPDGVLVIVGGRPGDWLGPLMRPLSAVFINPFVDQEFAPFLAELRQEDLQLLAELMQTGKVRSVIDRTYGLEEVSDAIRYSEEGHARGKIVVSVD
jgi:NADPH:quinone reductase-like Zn-dependent oxidoreductase